MRMVTGSNKMDECERRGCLKFLIAQLGAWVRSCRAIDEITITPVVTPAFEAPLNVCIRRRRQIRGQSSERLCHSRNAASTLATARAHQHGNAAMHSARRLFTACKGDRHAP